MIKMIALSYHGNGICESFFVILIVLSLSLNNTYFNKYKLVLYRNEKGIFIALEIPIQIYVN